MALLAELVLILAVLNIGLTDQQPGKSAPVLTSIRIRPPAEKAKDLAKPDPPRASKALQPPRQVQAAVAPPTTPTRPPAFIPLSKNEMTTLDISQLPRQPQPAATSGKSMMGPPDQGVPGDSRRVGSAPGGQPLYAATWYREPSNDELRGYLSTASPGWALIACQTVADFRVENCVAIDEHPSGSQLLRAVLAASWQFRVRPARVGGVSQVGSWVRIRIDYTERGN